MLIDQSIDAYSSYYLVIVFSLHHSLTSIKAERDIVLEYRHGRLLLERLGTMLEINYDHKTSTYDYYSGQFLKIII